MDRHSDYRDTFIDEIRILSGLEASASRERVLEAFRNVPRERYAGNGPWKLRSPLHTHATVETPNADPRYLYHCALIVLDETQGINIGEPSMWARLLTRADVRENSSVLQIGAGTGYYTAILSQLVGAGRVLAFEAEQILALAAQENLADRKSVEVRHGNGACDLMDDDGLFDFIVAFAGVTHPATIWLDHLAPNGRLLLPVTGALGLGAMILMEQGTPIMNAITLGSCGFYPCTGARDATMAKRIDEMWKDRTRMDGWRMQISLKDNKVQYWVDGLVF
jgi:protein-L-isoaspartate(D-aspartate) O-methyltransferase